MNTDIIDNQNTTPIDNTPPQRFERDENGLLKHIQYKFTSEGLVDYRAMVPKKYLYVNPSLGQRERIEAKYGKKYKEIDVELDKVEDSDLILLLSGVKFLAAIRGVVSILYQTVNVSQEFASVIGTMTFIPNFETEGQVRVFSDGGSASLMTTKGFGQKYLLEMSINRSFCRCVRNFLRINIVSKEELGGDEESQPSNGGAESTDSLSKLIKLMETKGVTFDRLKKKMISQNVQGAEYFETVNDIPALYVLDMVGVLNKYNPKAKE